MYFSANPNYLPMIFTWAGENKLLVFFKGGPFGPFLFGRGRGCLLG